MSVDSLPTSVAPTDVTAIVRWALERFGDRLAVATSLGVEDTALLHAVSEVAVDLGRAPFVFFLDTGRMHEATYMHLDRVRERYALPIEVVFPDRARVEALVREQGLYGLRASLEARKACCAARKLEPLSRALEGRTAWMTGLRRAQAETRASVEIVERDDAHGGITKVNPLAHWDDARLADYVATKGVSVHPLHREGYPSIGCEPCTRAVAPGEHPRAGRWWWESAEHKECGLHPGRALPIAR